MEDAFNLHALDEALAGTPFAHNLRFFPAIHSTNTLAMQEGEAGAPEGMVYFADQQTAGRGRGGHSWQSPPGSGLYVSVLLRPRIAPADVLWFSLAAGLAVHKTVEQITSHKADLRWPNDLLFGPRKFCGILTELNAEVTRVRHLVIGIGINVHQEAFPNELSAQATSLRIETKRHWPRQELLTTLLQAIYEEYLALAENLLRAAESILDRIEGSSSWIKGKRVQVDEAGGYSGVHSRPRLPRISACSDKRRPPNRAFRRSATDGGESLNTVPWFLTKTPHLEWDSLCSSRSTSVIPIRCSRSTTWGRKALAT